MDEGKDEWDFFTHLWTDTRKYSSLLASYDPRSPSEDRLAQCLERVIIETRAERGSELPPCVWINVRESERKAVIHALTSVLWSAGELDVNFMLRDEKPTDVRVALATASALLMESEEADARETSRYLVRQPRVAFDKECVRLAWWGFDDRCQTRIWLRPAVSGGGTLDINLVDAGPWTTADTKWLRSRLKRLREGAHFTAQRTIVLNTSDTVPAELLALNEGAKQPVVRVIECT